MYCTLNPETYGICQKKIHGHSVSTLGSSLGKFRGLETFRAFTILGLVGLGAWGLRGFHNTL